MSLYVTPSGNATGRSIHIPLKLLEAVIGDGSPQPPQLHTTLFKDERQLGESCMLVLSCLGLASFGRHNASVHCPDFPHLRGPMFTYCGLRLLSRLQFLTQGGCHHGFTTVTVDCGPICIQQLFHNKMVGHQLVAVCGISDSLNRNQSSVADHYMQQWRGWS